MTLKNLKATQYYTFTLPIVIHFTTVSAVVLIIELEMRQRQFAVIVFQVAVSNKC